jgi:hypothetical protein
MWGMPTAVCGAENASVRSGQRIEEQMSCMRACVPDRPPREELS